MQNSHPPKLSEKQFTKITLFRSVKQINGERIFKMLYQNCIVAEYKERTADKELALKHNFIYVIDGEVFVYKIKRNGAQKSLIRSYRAEQYCGFQDYPLFWEEQLEIQVNSHSKLVIVPLGHFYRFFRRVIPMTYLQSKAEYLKKLALFKGVELQKIFKLACVSQKYRVAKESILTKEGEAIQNIFLICSGKLELISSLIKQPIYCKQNEDFLVKEVRQNIPICYFTSKCVAQAQILAIPKGQLKKIIDIKLKLQQTLMKDDQIFKQHTISIDDNEKHLQPFPWNNTKLKHSEPSLSQTYYAKASTEKTPTRKRQIRSAYKPRQTLHTFPSQQDCSQSRTSQNQSQNISLGEIQLLKFIKRKQKVQSRNFFKYIESRAPQIIINPSKQFALVKPIYKNSSQYVRNMKRKIKQSMLMSFKGHSPISINPFQL